MNCDRAKSLLGEYVAQELSASRLMEVDEHLEGCPACRGELVELQQVWRLMGRLPSPEPSPILRMRFTDMVAAYKEGQRSSGLHRLEQWLRGVWPQRPAWQAGLAAACLLVGLGGGFLIGVGRPAGGASPELLALRGEVAGMRQVLTLSLLQQQSPSDRLKGVNWSAQVEQPAPEVPDALLAAVERDENVNVRLAAVDALHGFVGEERIRMGLLSSLPRQDSQLVQIAIIDVLSQKRHPDSTQALSRFARSEGIDVSVKKRALAAVDESRFE